LEACERLLEYVVDEEDKNTAESEITELKMGTLAYYIHASMYKMNSSKES
jgi:hypothetical protein